MVGALLLAGFLGGVLEPIIEGSARMFANVGLQRAGGGFSGEETMVLTELRNAATPLSPEDDVRVGLALVDVYDFRLQDPGRAMAELRRLIDLHPESRHTRMMRGVLQDLKVAHFGTEFPDLGTPPAQT